MLDLTCSMMLLTSFEKLKYFEDHDYFICHHVIISDNIERVPDTEPSMP